MAGTALGNLKEAAGPHIQTKTKEVHHDSLLTDLGTTQGITQASVVLLACLHAPSSTYTFFKSNAPVQQEVVG
jgi:hypothetical protein